MCGGTCEVTLEYPVNVQDLGILCYKIAQGIIMLKANCVHACQLLSLVQRGGVGRGVTPIDSVLLYGTLYLPSLAPTGNHVCLSIPAHMASVEPRGYLAKYVHCMLYMIE